MKSVCSAVQSLPAVMRGDIGRYCSTVRTGSGSVCLPSVPKFAATAAGLASWRAGMRTAAAWFALLVLSAAAFEFPSFSSTPAPAKAPSAEQQAPSVRSVASTEQPAKPAWSSAHHLALAAAIIALVGAAAAFAAPHGRKQTAEQQALARAQAQRDAAQRDAEVEEMCALANAREQRRRGLALAAAPAAAAAAAAAAAEAEPETACWGCGARDERGDFKACAKCVAIMHRPSKFCSEACLRSARQHAQEAAWAVRKLSFCASSGRSVARGLARLSAPALRGRMVNGACAQGLVRVRLCRPLCRSRP